MKVEALKAKGIRLTAEAIDELRLPDDVIKTTQSYQNQRKWAETLRDEDWTVIDLGDNTADEVPGAYYEAELEILFPARSAPQTQRSQP